MRISLSGSFLAALVVMIMTFSYSHDAQAQAQPQTQAIDHPTPVTASPAAVLKVGTVHREPFVFLKNGKVSDGLSTDIWEEIAKRNNYNFTWQLEEKFPELLRKVEKSEIDLAIANISITSKRERVMDFSQPIYDSGLQILVPKGGGGGTNFLKIIWESGLLMLIGLAVLVLLIIAHVLWFFERNVEDPRHDYFRDDYFGGVWDAFWWAFIIMTMGGFEKEVPHTKFSRALAMFWIIASLFFISTITAKITTSLTVAELTSGIKSYKDLYGKRVGIARATTTSTFADSVGLPYVEFDDYLQAVKALEAGELDATIGGAATAQYYANHKGVGKIVAAGDVFAPDKVGIALPENSLLYEDINRTLLEIKEDGTYAKLVKKYFGK